MRFLFVFPRAHRVPPLLTAWWALLFSFNSFAQNEVTTYVHEFVKDSESAVSIDDIPTIMTGPLEYSMNDKGGVIGLCFWGDPAKPVMLDTKFMTTAMAIERKALVYHELGHCVCNRDHTTHQWFVKFLDWLGVNHKRSGLMLDGCPDSLMYPSLPSWMCLHRHWDLYKKEVFKDCHPGGLDADSLLAIPRNSKPYTRRSGPRAANESRRLSAGYTPRN